MEQDNRKAVRIKKPLVVQISNDGRTWDMSHMRDLSEIGMQITSGGNLTVGEVLKFRTKIPLDPFVWFEFSGKVIHCEAVTTRFGPVSETQITCIEFVDLNEEQKAVVRKYVAWVISEEEKLSTRAVKRKWQGPDKGSDL